MRKIFLLILINIITAIFLFSSNEKLKDEIHVFLECYENDKRINISIYLEIVIIGFKDNYKWFLNQVEFHENELDNKSTIVAMYHYQFNDYWNFPVIENIKWNPGKSFECEYNKLTNDPPIILKAVKGQKGKYNWNVYGIGSILKDGKKEKFELKSKQSIKLKYNEIKLPTLYR